jgi:uncharacterized alpha-E superfamily protein
VEVLDKLRGAVVGLDIERAIRTDIHEVLTRIVDRTAEVSQAIGEEYFYAVLTPSQLEPEAIEA